MAGSAFQAWCPIDIANSAVGVTAFSAVVGGAGAYLGGARNPAEILMGVAAGAMVGALNHALHHMLFSNKDKAYKYMIDQSNSGKHEVAGVETDGRNIIVFKEEGNTYKTSNVYFTTKVGKTYVKFNNELYPAKHSIHTHPGKFIRDNWNKNPLDVSSKDQINGNTFFNGNIRIIMENQLFPVNVSNPELLTPGNPIWQLK